MGERSGASTTSTGVTGLPVLLVELATKTTVLPVYQYHLVVTVLVMYLRSAVYPTTLYCTVEG
jgi:hypothetical protein